MCLNWKHYPWIKLLGKLSYSVDLDSGLVLIRECKET